MVLVAFTAAALVTYAVVLAVLTAASVSSGERWLDEEQDAEGEQGDRDGAMLTTRPTDPWKGPHAS